MLNLGVLVWSLDSPINYVFFNILNLYLVDHALNLIYLLSLCKWHHSNLVSSYGPFLQVRLGFWKQFINEVIFIKKDIWNSPTNYSSLLIAKSNLSGLLKVALAIKSIVTYAKFELEKFASAMWQWKVINILNQQDLRVVSKKDKPERKFFIKLLINSLS